MNRIYLLHFLISLLLLSHSSQSLAQEIEVRLDPWTTKAGLQSTYYPMVEWDSSPYKEFTYLKRSGPDTWDITEYLNFRMLFPKGYDATVEDQLYPMIIMLHGAGESGIRWTNNFDYANGYNGTPPEPEKVDNNDHQLLFGGQEFLEAGGLPENHPRAFNGFVVFPQVSYNGNWSGIYSNGPTGNNRQVLELTEKLVQNHNIDPNRIYVFGLSNGARGCWDLINRRPDLYAASVVFSGVGDKQLMSERLAHFPLWVFQGGKDENPTPSAAEQMVQGLVDKGGNPRLTIYEDLGHGVWDRAFQEPDLYSWLLSNSKLNIHVYFGETHFNTNDDISAILGVSPGFLQYQWKRNGEIVNDSVNYNFTATSKGAYQVRVFRDSGWSRWSDPVFITSDEEKVEVPGLPIAYRVNVGGPNLTDETGNWSADNVDAPSPYVVQNSEQRYYVTDNAIDNFTTLPDDIFLSGIQTTLEGATINYKFPIKTRAKIILYFADPERTEAASDNIFDINIEGRTIVSHFNLSEEAGADAFIKTFEVDIKDEYLDIELKNIAGSTLLSGIEIRGINTITAVPEQKEKRVIVFPNPFRDELQIQHFNSKDPIKLITLYDIRGKMCFQKQNAKNEQKIYLKQNIENISAGIYYLVIEFGSKKNQVIKVIKRNIFN